ncbi:MAG: hypothetical protein KY460_09800 [Actinobacteria bacterium]|nr:hypothetical protein [Actinomycetota bacterium]
MTTARSDGFERFYREHAAAVFDLALRHGGDHTVAVDCVDAVFAELATRWRQVSDPLRFCRRAAVLFVCGSRHGRRPRQRCLPGSRLQRMTAGVASATVSAPAPAVHPGDV